MNPKLVKQLLRAKLPIHIMQPGTKETKLNVKITSILYETFCAAHDGITYGFRYSYVHTAIVNETGVTFIFL